MAELTRNGTHMRLAEWSARERKALLEAYKHRFRDVSVVVSFGGVGSSSLLEWLFPFFPTNHYADVDNMKHLPWPALCGSPCLGTLTPPLRPPP